MAKNNNNQLKTILVVVILALFVYFIFKNVPGGSERYDLQGVDVHDLKYKVGPLRHEYDPKGVSCNAVCRKKYPVDNRKQRSCIGKCLGRHNPNVKLIAKSRLGRGIPGKPRVNRRSRIPRSRSRESYGSKTCAAQCSSYAACLSAGYTAKECDDMGLTAQGACDCSTFGEVEGVR